LPSDPPPDSAHAAAAALGISPDQVPGDLPPKAAQAAAAALGIREIKLASETEREAVSFSDRRTQYLREIVAGCIMVVFIVANSIALYLLFRLMILDQRNLRAHLIAPGDRIITGQVIMALLGATTVQVGAIAAIMARYLFPGRSRD